MKNKSNGNLISKIGGRGFSFYIMTALALLNCVFSVLFALFIKLFVNAVEYKKGASQITLYAVLLCLSVLLSFVCGVLYKVLHAKCATRLELKLKKHVFERYVKSSFSNVTAFSSGDVVSRLESDSQKVANTHVALIPSALSTIVHLISILALLLFMQPLFTLILLACMAVAFLVSYAIRKAIFSLNSNTRSSEGKTASFIGEVTSNALFIKSSTVENGVTNIANANFLSVYKNKLKQRVFSSGVSSLISFAFTAVYAITIIWAVLRVNSGASGIDYGTLIAILQLGYQIKNPIMSLSAYIPAYYEMQSSLHRHNELISEEEVDKIDASNFEFISATLNGVSFSYDNKNAVLDGVNIEINAGDRVVIKGESGIGKSTLLKLLTGVYKPNSGTVTLRLLDRSGKEIEVEPSKVKGLFAFVPQGNMLFAGSLYSNLTMLNENASLSEVEEAVKIACLQEVSKNGFDLEVGNSGSSLSEGQAQRVAIARALISKYKVIIFDEATSALDESIESQIIDNLKDVKGVTLVSVSHKAEIEKICNKRYSVGGGTLKKN